MSASIDSLRSSDLNARGQELLELAGEGPITRQDVIDGAQLISDHRSQLSATLALELRVFQHALAAVDEIVPRWDGDERRGTLQADWKTFSFDGIHRFLERLAVFPGSRLDKLTQYGGLTRWLSGMILRVMGVAFLHQHLKVERRDLRRIGRFLEEHELVYSSLEMAIEAFNEAAGREAVSMKDLVASSRPLREELGKFASFDDYREHVGREISLYLVEGLQLGQLSADQASQVSDYVLPRIDEVRVEASAVRLLGTLASQWPVFSELYERERLRLELPGPAPTISKKPSPGDQDFFGWSLRYYMLA